MRAWNIGLGSPLKEILAIGAHSDDIEIGAAGTLLWLRQCYPDARVRWVVLCATGERRDEAEHSARSILGNANCTVDTFDFRDGFFPYDGARVKDVFEKLKATAAPDVILSHHG